MGGTVNSNDPWMDAYGINTSNMIPMQQQQGGLFNDFTSGLGKSFNTDFMGTLGGVGDIATGLYGMYQGNQVLGMYEDQLDINKDKWKEAKGELAHKRGTRSHLTASYMA